ncbi:polyketide synthase dehydratase domain-containing protein, partial [Streptomyces sp. NPDC006134]|uniref:polyketide synthase dehydratase domain-containing protein n=1 Tax=Streptomyces sp. NPDC006134 TaxID=3154467 RepID=UPI003403B0B8
PVDWTGILPSGATTARVDLPTYAFDHRHYWLRTARTATDATSLGQTAVDHPLLGAMVRLPHSDGLVFTSRLSLTAQPWLGDHLVGGVVVLPGTALTELAVRAGDEAGCGVLEELVTDTPLVLPEQGGVRVQVAVGAPDENGSRTLEIYSQREDAPGDGDAWTRHATGTLSPAPSARPADFDFAVWPPAGAEAVGIEDFYTELAEQGDEYGPAFRGVRAVWRRGDEIFAEVALPEEQREDAARFAIHPALLDAALHAHTLGGATAGDHAARRPLDWNGLVLHAVGASALRVRLRPGGPGLLALEAADETGGPVVTADSVAMRELTAERLANAGDAAAPDALFGVEWTGLPSGRGPVAVPSWVPVAAAEDIT